MAVDPEHRDDLAFIIGLIDPDHDRRLAARAQLPGALATWDGGMIFELALTVMPLTAAGFVAIRSLAPVAADLPRYAASLAQAADIIRHWPEGLMKALGAGVRKRAVSRENVRYMGMGHYLAGLKSELLPPLVRSALSDALAPITLSSNGIPVDHIGMREAALLTGQAEHRLAIARRRGHLATRICLRANRLLPTLDRAEIEALNDFFENRLGPEAFTHRLHLPQYAMRQLVDEKLVTCNNHPYVVAHYEPFQMDESDLAALRAALERAAVPADAIRDPIPLHRAARAMGGGAKPWGRIIRELLDGSIPYSIAGGSVDRIQISSADAAKLRTRNLTVTSTGVGSRYVSQRDAAEILNLPLKHMHVLPVSGGTGARAHRIPWSRVRRIARNRVTLTELSARSGIHATRLKGMLERDGCGPHDALGWMRRKALAKIVNY